MILKKTLASMGYFTFVCYKSCYKKRSECLGKSNTFCTAQAAILLGSSSQKICAPTHKHSARRPAPAGRPRYSARWWGHSRASSFGGGRFQIGTTRRGKRRSIGVPLVTSTPPKGKYAASQTFALTSATAPPDHGVWASSLRPLLAVRPSLRGVLRG